MFTAKKFHVTEKGEAKPCKAYVKGCPITAKTGGEHFETMELAQQDYERQEEQKNFFTITKQKSNNLSDKDIKQHHNGDYYVELSKWGGTEYKFGDLTHDIEDVKRLHKADSQKEFQDGSCGVLANELWNVNPYVKDYCILTTQDEPEVGVHQFVKLKDGTYADSQGIWSKKNLVDYWKEVDPTVKLRIVRSKKSDGTLRKSNPSSIKKFANRELYESVSEILNKRFKK